MKNQNNRRDFTSPVKSKFNHLKKDEVNLKKNSTLYFQVGLILCLLFAYGLLEMQFEQVHKDYSEIVFNDPDEFITYISPVIEQPAIEQPVQKTQPKRLIDQYHIEPVNYKDKDAKIIVDPPARKLPLAISDIPNIKPPAAPVEVPFHVVEQVPTFPGCEEAKNNAERKKCMSEKLSQHIQKEFDTDLASELGLVGIQQINVMFKIDVDGRVTDIKARSKHKALEQEAIDVIGKLPKLTPGRQKNKSVPVIYGLPIKFKVQQ